MTLALAVALSWIAVGLYAVASGLRFRRYVKSLPKSTGNRRLQREHRTYLWFGVGALAVGAWR